MSRHLRLLAFCAVLGFAAPVYAQQTVAVAGLIEDKCANPAIVLSYVFDGSDASHGDTASGNIQIVALSSGQHIHFCSGTLQGSTAGDILVRFGTGTACASSPTNIAVVQVEANGEGKAITSSTPTFLRTPNTGMALCISLSTSMQVRGEIRYWKG